MGVKLLFLSVIYISLTMVITCVAWGCTNCLTKGCGISFHRFPYKNPQLLQKWIQAIRRRSGNQQNTAICVVYILKNLVLLSGLGKLDVIYITMLYLKYLTFQITYRKQQN